MSASLVDLAATSPRRRTVTIQLKQNILLQELTPAEAEEAQSRSAIRHGRRNYRLPLSWPLLLQPQAQKPQEAAENDGLPMPPCSVYTIWFISNFFWKDVHFSSYMSTFQCHQLVSNSCMACQDGGDETEGGLA